MATKDLGVRFTEEKYATKSEVSKDLGISLVDNIWNNILLYRAQFNRSLSVRSIEGNTIAFCYCPAVSDLINQIEFKLIKLLKDYGSMPSNTDNELFRKQSMIECLRSLAQVHKLEVSDEYLRALIDGDLKDIAPSNKILSNYYNALFYIERAYVNNIDIDFLAEIYSRITGIEELVTFYRTTENKNKENRVLIDRIYSAAPVGAIDTMMNSLMSFLQDSPLSDTIKSIVTYYYINYVKPFPEYNDEIAVLMMKAVLAHNNLSEVGTFLNLERFLFERIQENTKACIEVQKTSDITYFVKFAIAFLNDIARELSDKIANFNAVAIKTDFYREDKEEAPVQQDSPVVQEERIAEPQPAKQEQIAIQVEQAQLAVNYIPRALDEKEASRLEQDLIESDPSLKRGEAYFYARHCTMNRRYTISQYKKELGCAYETARTSMEHLVKLGYYRKEQIKNKFVYTPVLRKKEAN